VLYIGVTLVLYRSNIFDVIILDWGIIHCSYFGQSLMYISVEHLIEHIKNVFKIDELVKEYQNASGKVLLTVLPIYSLYIIIARHTNNI
jgi:hypothetical protein